MKSVMGEKVQIISLSYRLSSTYRIGQAREGERREKGARKRSCEGLGNQFLSTGGNMGRFFANNQKRKKRAKTEPRQGGKFRKGEFEI